MRRCPDTNMRHAARDMKMLTLHSLTDGDALNGCITRRRYGATIVDAYFAEPAALPECDVVYYHQVSRPPRHGRAEPFKTILIDLTNSEGALLAQFHSRNRTQIRRAERSDGLVYDGPRQDNEAIAGFVTFYAAHAPVTGPPCMPPRRLENLARAGALSLTAVRDADGGVLAQHAYVTRASRARLLHSCSVWRELHGSAERNRVARANRWCHWRDMRLFRQLGFSTFDFGGYDESDGETAGIAAFKRQFGGFVVEEYNSVVALTRRGTALLRARDLSHGLRSVYARA
jgi:hypothetical protein